MKHFFDEMREKFEEEKEKSQHEEKEFDDDGWGDDWEDEIYE
jgi:hypothetical protein